MKPGSPDPHPSRPYLFYSDTVALCSKCLNRVLGKVLIQDGQVFLEKRCALHGSERVLLADDVDYFRKAREIFIKPPEQTHRYNTGVVWSCPYDCGICPEHEQHSCVSLLEITDLCNLSCPTCYSASGPEKLKHRSLECIQAMISRIVQNEGTADVVQVSGGEPTLHPEFFEVLGLLKRQPIRHLMVNTNGLKIAADLEFTRRLSGFAPGFEVYLQWDSQNANALKTLRGQDLRKQRLRALDHLNQLGLSTTLVVTVQRGVNEEELGSIIEFALGQDAVRGVTFQPTSYSGRVPPSGEQEERLTLTEVRRRITEQCPHFLLEDLLPVPCNAEHIAMAYGIKTQNGFHALTRHLPTELLLEGPRNTISFEKDDVLKKAMLGLLSTGIGPEASADKAAELLCCLPQVQAPTGFDYRNVFRVVISEFMDRHNFTIYGARKSCVHVAHPDGKRMIPLDLYNLFYRDELEQERLAPLRRNADVFSRLS